MQNLHKCLAFTCLSALFLTATGCETYGPASRYQNSFPMEHAFYDGADTSSIYASARFTSGRTYRDGDKNQAGELSVYKSWVGSNFHGSAGLFGQIGEYSVNDTLRLGYNNFGFRSNIGVSAIWDNTEVGFINLAFAMSYEGGQYHSFRERYELGNQSPQSVLNPDPTVDVPSRWVTDVQTYFSVRQRFDKNRALSFGSGFGYSFNNEFSIYPLLNFSYQFNKTMHANLSGMYLSSSGKIGNNSLHSVYSLGFTYGF